MSVQRQGEPNEAIDIEPGSVLELEKHHDLAEINPNSDLELKEGFGQNHGVLSGQSQLESSDTSLSTSVLWMAVNTLATIAIVSQLWAECREIF